MKVHTRIIDALGVLRANAPTLVFGAGLLVVCASIAAVWSIPIAGMFFGAVLMLIGLLPSFAMLGAARRKD